MKKLAIILLFFALCVSAQAQTATALMPIPKVQFFGANGKPLVGGKLFSYAAGTTTPQATFTDSTGLVQNTNPVILDAGGFASVWINGLVYKFILQDQFGVQQWSVDNVSDIGKVIQGNFLALAPPANVSQSVSGPVNLGIYNVTAGYFLSNSANPPGSGQVRLANTDTISWQNQANGAAVTLSDNGTASSSNGNLADVLKWGGGGFESGAFIDASGAPAQSGVVRTGNNTCQMAARNAAASGDVCAALVDTSNVVNLGGSAGVKVAGPVNANNQNIINSNLISANANNAVSLLSGCTQGPAGAITGNAADQAIYTCTIAANVLGPGKSLHIKVASIHSTGTTSTTYKLKFDSNAFDSFPIANANNTFIDVHNYTITNSAGVQNAQRFIRESIENVSGAATSVPAVAIGSAGTVDFTQSHVLTFTFNVANTDAVTPVMIQGEIAQ